MLAVGASTSPAIGGRCIKNLMAAKLHTSLLSELTVSSIDDPSLKHNRVGGRISLFGEAGSTTID